MDFFLHKQTEVVLHVVFEGLKDKKIGYLGILTELKLARLSSKSEFLTRNSHVTCHVT